MRSDAVLDAPDPTVGGIDDLELELPIMTCPVLGDLDPVRLRAVQEVLLDPSLVLRAIHDPDDDLVDFICEDANRGAADSLEMDSEALVGSLLSQVLPGETGDFLFEQCLNAVASGAAMRFDDYQVIDPDGGPTRHYDIRGLPLGDRVCFTWRDVSARIRNEQALAESRNRYRLLAEYSSDVVLLLSADGTVEWASPSTREMLGWDPEELVGRGVADVVHHEDVTRVNAVRRHPSTVRPRAEEIRIRCVGGEHLWVAATQREVRGADGELTNRVIALTDIQKNVQARAALKASEERFRTLAENISDVVLASESGRCTWVSPSIAWVLGWNPDDLVGRPVLDLIAPEDRERAAEATAEASRRGVLELIEIRFLTAAGETRWMQIHSRAVDTAPPHRSFVTGLQDIHERRSHRKLRAGLAAVDAVLVGVEDEHALLIGVCRVLVEQTPTELAWFARGTPGGDAVSVVAVEGRDDRLLTVGERCPAAVAHLATPAVAALRSGTVEFEVGQVPSAPPPSAPGPGNPRFALTTAIPIEVDGIVELVLVDHRTDVPLLDEETRATLDQLARQIGLALSRIRARIQLVAALNEQALLSTAIEQAGESVLVTDLEGVIAYANPATAALTGYSVEEIVGGTAERFASGLHGSEFFDGITESLLAGVTWRGVIVYQNRDGQLFEGETTVTAMRDDDGEIYAYVSVVRNISWELKLEADLDRLQSDRASVVAAMTGVRVGSTIEATAASFCQAVTRLEDIDLARVLLVEADDRVIPLGITGRAFLDWEVGVPVTFAHLAEIVDVSRSGSWWLPIADLPEEDRESDPLVRPLVESGFVSIGFAPVWWEGDMVAVVATLSRTPEGGRWTDDRTTVLEELSSFAGTALGAQAGRRGEWSRLRDDIRSIIDRVACHPVFQPVVGLDGGETVGYEALTRFDDGRRPDLVFEDAASVGLGVELETVCAVAAVRAATVLPPGAWLAVNFSPSAVIAGSVGTVVDVADRPLVVEITEHVEVESYAAVRSAMRAYPGVRVSVDDAGAGYASLRHILELQPDFVKLDIGLVHNIDTDPARQALAAGLRHYAEETGNTLIAEGVETPGERATLYRLGIPLAQGYLFGHPAPARELVAP